MRTPAETDVINRILKANGLPTLDNPAVLQALGSRVTDHEHLRTILARCEPERRIAMYDSLKPYLRFTAHPLDWYIARSAEKAEAQELPTLDADGYHWSKMPHTIRTPEDVIRDAKQHELAMQYADHGTDEQMIANVVHQALTKYHLEVTCKRCTKTETFHGGRRIDAVMAAREAGWVYCREGDQAWELCPDCPGGRN